MSKVEILEFLSPETREDVQQAALKLLISISSNSDDSAWTELFLSPDLKLVQKLMSLLEKTRSSFIAGQIIQIFVNISARERYDQELFYSRSFLIQLLSHCERSAEQKELSKSCASLLANMSGTEGTASRILTVVYGEDQTDFSQISRLFQQFFLDSSQESLGYFLRNLSQLEKIRHLIIHSSNGEILINCLQILKSAAVPLESKRVAVDLVKNCSFEVGKFICPFSL